MKNKNFNQSGFSLIELLIAATLMVMLFTVFGAFLLGLTNASAEVAQVQKITESVEFSVASLREDLEKSGGGLTISDKQSYTGDANAAFLSHPDYNAFNNSYFRQTESTTKPLTSDVFFAGSSEVSLRGSNMVLTVQETASNLMVKMTRELLPTGTERVTVETPEGVEEFTRNSVNGSAVLKVNQNTVRIGNEIKCSTSTSVDDIFLSQNVEQCSGQYKEVLAAAPLGETLSDFNLYAANIKKRQTNVSANMPVQLPLLPVWNGVRMDLPVIKTNDGFVVFNSAVADNSLFLTKDATFSGSNPAFGTSGTKQVAVLNDTTALKNGDVLFIFDIPAGRSIVVGISGINGKNVSVTPVTSLSRSKNYFDGLYSDQNDFQGFTFNPGTRVVRVERPTEYRIQTENRITSLYRRKTGFSWELVLPRIENYSFNVIRSNSRTAFELSFDVLSEDSGVMLTNDGAISARETVRLNILPRSLNRTFDTR